MLTAIGVGLLLIVVVLAAPVTVNFKIARQNELDGEVRIRALYGFVRVKTRLPRSSTKRDSTELNKQPRPDKSDDVRGSLFALVRQKPLRRRVFRCLRDLWNAVHTQDLFLRLRIGLGDPADTGKLWALMGPVSGYLASRHGSAVILEPEFFNATFEFDSAGQVRVVPLTLIYHALGLAFSPTVWRGVRRMRTKA